MINNLTKYMTRLVKSLRGEVRFNETNMQDVLRKVRQALIEADVALPVIKYFINQIQEKSLGKKILNSLTPGQALINIIQNELTLLMGDNNINKHNSKINILNLSVSSPAVILVIGLQGSGKTTTVGKLAYLLHFLQKKKVLTVSCDIYRPAAISQLEIITRQANADFFPSTSTQSPLDIVSQALEWSKNHFYDVLIVDTAGRLNIDQIMMQELINLFNVLKPIETLLIVDSMMGQDAINIAKSFNEVLKITGIILTKLDGDSRGGAALSVKFITGTPIKFTGVGEKIDKLEVFYPDRMAKRILGMGDILSIIEQTQNNLHLKISDSKILNKIKKNNSKFDLNDFSMQLKQVKKIGGLSIFLSKLPSSFQVISNNQNLLGAEKQLRRMESIIQSMTPIERTKPELIKGSRKRRIANGAGVKIQEVNQLLTQFEQIRNMIKKVKLGNLNKIIRGLH